MAMLSFSRVTVRALTWSALLLCAGAGAMAQPARDARANESLPANPHANQWHFDPVLHKAWIYKDGSWMPFPAENCRSLIHCNGHVILKTGFHYMLARENGEIVVPKAPAIRCYDGFVALGSYSRIEYLLDAQGDTVSALVDNCRIYEDTVQGAPVYCFPQYQAGLERYNCFDLRNWGMMNAQGLWVIEPKFDKPFKFTNGQAAVVYKGAHLKIDETGAFVEE